MSHPGPPQAPVWVQPRPGAAAQLRQRLAELRGMELGPQLDGSLASLRDVKEALIARAERLVRAAVAGSRIPPRTVRSFERDFDDLQVRRSAVTDQLSAAADQRRDEAARDAGRARTRVAVSAAAAIAGLLLLALMLDRVGASLATVLHGGPPRHPAHLPNQ